MDPNVVPADNWTDIVGVLILGPFVHGIVYTLGKFQAFQNEDLLKGLGIGLCFGLMWLFSRWFDPTMTPKLILLAGAAAWGAASGTKLVQSVSTKVVMRNGSVPPTP